MFWVHQKLLKGLVVFWSNAKSTVCSAHGSIPYQQLPLTVNLSNLNSHTEWTAEWNELRFALDSLNQYNFRVLKILIHRNWFVISSCKTFGVPLVYEKHVQWFISDMDYCPACLKRLIRWGSRTQQITNKEHKAIHSQIVICRLPEWTLVKVLGFTREYRMLCVASTLASSIQLYSVPSQNSKSLAYLTQQNA